MSSSQQASGPRLTLRLLGGFSVLAADGSVPQLSYAKLRALLVCLALERGNELSRSWLAGLLWPEFDEEAARQNLRRALSNLRTALCDADGDASLFRISRTSIAFAAAPPIDVDAADFLVPPSACDIDGADRAGCRECLLRMEILAGRYRGELLPGFSLPDSPEFDEWLAGRRATAQRHALLLLDRLAACHAARSASARALPFALRALDLDPWNEDRLRRAMRIYASGGQASAALACFAGFRRRLEEELGVPPDPETVRFAEEIGRALPLPVPDAGSDAGPERRPVTVVCCHLSPAAGGGDELLESLPALRQRCEALLREAGGQPVPMPGGVLAYFGLPKADERTPLRAVGAALAISRSPEFAGIDLRIGVHGGRVLCDLAAGEFDVAGNASAIAMAMPALLAGGMVALTLPTCRLVADHFECEALGSWRPGGSRRPLSLFRLCAARSRPARGRSVPFVGREQESARIAAAWQAALAGRRQALLVRGEAGIGKSRLTQRFADQVFAEGGRRLRFSCQAESAQEVLQPVLSLLLGTAADEAGEADGAPPRARLLARLQPFFPDEGKRVEALAGWLLDAGRQTPAADEGARERALDSLHVLAERLAERQPLLLLFEDLHWADPSTLDLLDRFCRRRGTARILLLATARPEFVPPAGWAQLPLAALPPGPATAMVTAVAGERPLTAATVRRIVEQADGVPLFVEEIARALIGDGSDAETPGLPAIAPAIPHSLRDLLAARLDALDAARSFAQHAAVLGRRFEIDLLARLVEASPEALDAALARLDEAAVVSRDGAYGEFRHALIREAALQSLSPAKRRQLHRRAADLLRRHRLHRVEQQPGLIAHHYTEAGDAGEALAFHSLAADQALRYSAYREHVWHLRQALAQLDRLRPTPATAGVTAMEIGLLAQLGWAIGEVEGLGSTAARDACQRAFALCRGADGGPELFKTLLGLWRGSSSWSGYAQSRELGERLLAVAEAAGDPQQLALARYALGNVHCALGNLDASIHHLRRCLKHYRPEMPVSLYGDSAGVGAHAFLGWAHSLRGAAGAGLREAQAAVALARRLDHPPAIALALLFAAETHRLRREPAAALACAGEVVPVAEAAGIAAWGVFAEVFLGWGEALAGHRSGLERAARALDRVMDSIMAGTAAPLFALVAEAALAVGDRAHGLRATEEALTLMDENDGRHLQANLLLLRAELFAAGGDADAARACAREALTVAVGQGARLFELRAATLLLRLGVGGEAERDGILGRLQSLLRRGADGDELACRREARALVAAAGG